MENKNLSDSLVEIHTRFHNNNMTQAELVKKQYQLFKLYNKNHFLSFHHHNGVHFLSKNKIDVSLKERLFIFLFLCRILENKKQFDFASDFLRVCCQYHYDFGITPADLQLSNLGMQDGRMVIRDSYSSIRNDDDFTRIIRHRVHQGLALDEKMTALYKPLKIDLDVSWLALNCRSI